MTFSMVADAVLSVTVVGRTVGSRNSLEQFPMAFSWRSLGALGMSPMNVWVFVWVQASSVLGVVLLFGNGVLELSSNVFVILGSLGVMELGRLSQ